MRIKTDRLKYSSAANNSSKEGLLSFLNKDIDFPWQSFGAKEKAEFYHDLSLLVEMEIELISALGIVLVEVKSKQSKLVFVELEKMLRQGKQLSEAMQLLNGKFTAYECNIIKIGEATGRLAECLESLKRYYSDEVKIKKQILALLSYPTFVFLLGLVVVYFMLGFVVPVFKDVLKQSGRTLPEITEFLIYLSEIKNTLFMMVGGGILLVLYVHKYFKSNKSYIGAIHKMQHNIPVIGKLLVKIQLAKFCQVFKLMMKSKVHMNEALFISKDLITFTPLREAIEASYHSVVHDGKLFHESLMHHKIFPARFVSLIRIAEEVNAMDKVFEKLHEQLVKEIEELQLVVGKLIEPAIIVFLGLFVGGILIALYLPMFEINTITY